MKTLNHKNLGEVQVTDECELMNSQNGDSTSTFVIHDGELKEVTKALLSEPKKVERVER